jgi:hypothetical protein
MGQQFNPKFGIHGRLILWSHGVVPQSSISAANRSSREGPGRFCSALFSTALCGTTRSSDALEPVMHLVG